MTNNQQLLERFFSEEVIALERSSLFDIETEGKIPTFDFTKVEGMLLGLAIGDALGNTSESLIPRSRSELYGEINDYLPNKYVEFEKNGNAIGRYPDGVLDPGAVDRGRPIHS